MKLVTGRNGDLVQQRAERDSGRELVVQTVKVSPSCMRIALKKNVRSFNALRFDAWFLA